MPTVETAADLRGPYGGAANKDGSREIAVVTLNGSSQNIDLSGTNYFNSSNYQERFVRISCDTNCYYYWSNSASDSVSDTAADGTGQSTQGDALYANERREECPAGRYLVIKGTNAKLVRICITNQVSR
jgi:hypothetical protein